LNLGISALKYVEEVKNGNFTVEEFVSKTVEQIKKHDGTLHAYLSLDDNVIEQAKNLDKKIKNKEKVGSCFGMPISIKDNICVRGGKTTCASKINRTNFKSCINIFDSFCLWFKRRNFFYFRKDSYF